MIKSNKYSFPILQFQNLKSFKGLKHFITTKHGGVSEDCFESFNLGYNIGDRLDNVKFNRYKIGLAFGLHQDRLIFPNQTHSNTVKVIKEDFLRLDMVYKRNYLDGTDALVTSEPNLMLGITVADCVPLLFFEPVKKVIAVAHAGRKGTQLRIAQKTIKVMVEDFKCEATNLIVGIGPAISQKNYQVNAEIADIFKTEFAGYKGSWLESDSKDTYLLDLPQINKLQLLESGVLEENIEMSGLCTFNDKKNFYSYRQSKGNCGRFGCGIMLD